MDEIMRKKLTVAAAQMAKEHPVNFENNPNINRTEKTPPDIVYQGKIVGYYDTQIAMWRKGDRENFSLDDKTYPNQEELLQDLHKEFSDL